MQKGTVKWFNPKKGYGFIEPADGGKDLFVHVTHVQQAGLKTLEEGQAVEYDVESDGPRGRISAVNINLANGTSSVGTQRNGVVKWFNADKGYGFIKPDDSEVDIFVHISAVERAGRRSLHEDQRVRFTPRRTRGRVSAEDLQIED